MKFALYTDYRSRIEKNKVTASQNPFITLSGRKEIALRVIERIIILMKGSDYIMNLKKKES